MCEGVGRSQSMYVCEGVGRGVYANDVGRGVYANYVGRGVYMGVGGGAYVCGDVYKVYCT